MNSWSGSRLGINSVAKDTCLLFGRPWMLGLWSLCPCSALTWCCWVTLYSGVDRNWLYKFANKTENKVQGVGTKVEQKKTKEKMVTIIQWWIVNRFYIQSITHSYIMQPLDKNINIYCVFPKDQVSLSVSRLSVEDSTTAFYKFVYLYLLIYWSMICHHRMFKA